ncbi:metal ABC transporter permease [Salisediminibacterium halotolerans]|uniref:metal ABC transporter permease n=1 Tax=Salisediminibacterium halotolerans TaxID=517425 RepID=UPI000EAE02E7|nr:metal ABC transporter permease [Salisediminibacterium halotolerans]RLJ78133.1 iron/zinc/copper transport system permease protein [Actinophytocola xinjiangensis]RPE88528.1 iron/zinc/copper transport system permease protein [Salisediminibacterium halotolerans]TWG37110.1 iron/zinc/copper transport system permease protein [Salisediminibacterium halotolerans]GEL07248.1 manganese transport system membrane protein MntC [Salisediminibacterium halotolerans]
MIEQLDSFIYQLMNYPYLQNAMLAAVLVGIICGLIGCFIIMRGMALMGDAISHAVLPGVVAAYMIGVSFFIGAVITGVITALLIGYISQNSRIKEDSAIGIMFTAMFALGVVMITSLSGTGVDLWHILFGNVLAVGSTDVSITMGIGIIVILMILVFYRPLLLTTFDPTMAKASGLPVKLIHYVLMLLLSLVTVASLQTVGIILVVAMLITPGATAYLLTDRFSVMLVLAAAFGVMSAVIGIYFSVLYDVASGASIVLVASAFFVIVFLFGPKRGLVIRWITGLRRQSSTA